MKASEKTVGSFVLALASALVGLVASAAEEVKVGVVNWDCSLPSTTFFGGYATKSLSPAKYRHATPFYADVLGENSIDYHVRTVAEYEREMQYAIDAGIDYFAYCWYDETNPNNAEGISTQQNNLCIPYMHELTAARKLHVQSTALREKLKLCAILITVHPYTEDELARLAAAMGESYYQRALGRPLVYLFGGTGENEKLLTRLRAACRTAGAGDPYAVLLGTGFHSSEGDEGIQALSSYVDSKSGINSFSELASHGISCNTSRAAAGMPVVPHFTVGWDPSPRIDNPVPWCSYANTSYAPPATESELLAGARTLQAWIRNNRASCPTGHILAFAWNEWEEGGWICPSWGAAAPNTARTDAFAKCVQVWKGTEPKVSATTNYIENGSFEAITGAAVTDYVENGNGSATSVDGWYGGFITKGGSKKTFCSAAMADGELGIALHNVNPVLSNQFAVATEATYELTFRTVSRDMGEDSCKQTLSVYFDDETQSVCAVRPGSISEWSYWSVSCHLAAGKHTLRFVGTTPDNNTVDSSTIIDDVRLVLARENLLPNGSFEAITGNPVTDYAGNGEGSSLQNWMGNCLITCGDGKTFCEPIMANGTYGLALHPLYPSASNEFTLAKTDVYELTFRTVSRNMGKNSCKQTLSIYFDNETQSVCSVLPTSVDVWNFWSFKCLLKKGKHIIRLVGTTPPEVEDSSTIIDDVRICYPIDGLLVNGSFESIVYDPVSTVFPTEGYVANGESGVYSQGWLGGILTKGRGGTAAICQAPVEVGVYAMALHNAYPTLSQEFDATYDGTYKLTFRTVSRNRGEDSCKQTVSVYFDDETQSVCSVLPTSVLAWDSWAFKCKLKKGRHVIRFVGVTPDNNTVDSSTIIDDVKLMLERKDQGLAVRVK